VTARIDAIEARICEVEKRGLKYCGAWDAAESYRAGDAVTWAGSLYIAKNAATGVQPGLSTDDSRVWQMAVKKGKDGRDSRSVA
jgi:hypothetical protein